MGTHKKMVKRSSTRVRSQFTIESQGSIQWRTFYKTLLRVEPVFKPLDGFGGGACFVK